MSLPQPHRPSPHQRPGLRVALLLGLAGALSCDQCTQISNPNRGNVDRVSDVVLYEGADGHAYAVSANPELQHLRVLDLTDGRYLTGPNRYFPLSIPVGIETRRLAIATDGATEAPDPTRVYAVDAADDIVTIVDAAAFDVVGQVPTGRAPYDVAAIRVDAEQTLVAVTIPDDGVVEVQLVNEAGVAGDVTTVALPDGAVPLDIVSDAFGRTFVVSDAALPLVHVLERDVDGDGTTVTLARSLDVGGPTNNLAAGVVDVGDGLAPVVLALRSDTPAAMLVRLFRPGFPEDRYAVLGGTTMPQLGVVAYVPDARPSAAEVTVCCRGLDDGTLAAGEATAAFASVTFADGNVRYLALAADRIDGLKMEGTRRLVRLIDDDLAGLSAASGVDLNGNAELWVPAEGGEAFRPNVALREVDTFGTPPFVQTQDSTTLLLTWEGDLPGATRLRGTLAPATSSFAALVNLAPRGVRVGDVARLEAETAAIGCETEVFRARITAVDGVEVTFAVTDAGSDTAPAIASADLSRCLDGVGPIRLTVEAADAFVVTRDGASLGRLRFARDVNDDDDDGRVIIGSTAITVAAAGAGKPLQGSKLALPLDAHLQMMGISLSALGTVSLIPTGVAGGTITIPDASDDADGPIPARQMVFATASLNSSTGLPVLLSADEAETSAERVTAHQ